jgi:predicted alternative tryptophan synthase beta-subunit
MDGKLSLPEKEIPTSYVYDYSDREWFTHMLKMHTLGHSFDLSHYAALLTGKLRRPWWSLPRFLPSVIYY